MIAVHGEPPRRVAAGRAGASTLAARRVSPQDEVRARGRLLPARLALRPKDRCRPALAPPDRRVAQAPRGSTTLRGAAHLHRRRPMALPRARRACTGRPPRARGASAPLARLLLPMGQPRREAARRHGRSSSWGRGGSTKPARRLQVVAARVLPPPRPRTRVTAPAPPNQHGDPRPTRRLKIAPRRRRPVAGRVAHDRAQEWISPRAPLKPWQGLEGGRLTRVRRDDVAVVRCLRGRPGSPSRARGRRAGVRAAPRRRRLTSACAGTTAAVKPEALQVQLTPACAGSTQLRLVAIVHLGSPPRA